MARSKGASGRFYAEAGGCIRGKGVDVNGSAEHDGFVSYEIVADV